jgi:mercuric ion transport protein
MHTEEKHKNLLKIGGIGAIVAAICCSTPIFVLILSAIGLGALTVYLDYILLPILAGFIVLTIYGLFKVLKTRR